MAWFKAATPESFGGGVEIVTFADGTDEQIAAMLAAHYAGEIDVTEYWNVGDKRSIHINAMTADGVSEAHHADNYDYVIIGVNHDDLVTPINGITKAAITVQQDRIFFTDTTTVEDNSYDEAHEYGFIGSGNSTGWNTCIRRTWCNETYFNALPQYIQNNIKQVYKSTAHSGNTSSPYKIANIDKCFLLSEWEVFGSATYSCETGSNAVHYINSINSSDRITIPFGGTKYSYFDTSTNRYKLPKFGVSWVSCVWKERSPYYNNSTHFCCTYFDGSSTIDNGAYVGGIAPAFCL